jgi:hypothetical protein
MVTEMRPLISIVAGAAIAASLAVTPAYATPILANTTYVWTLGGVVSGSGHLTTANADGAGYDIVAFSGTIGGNAISGLLGGQPGTQATSPSGAFFYDNLILPGAQMFDVDGVLFTVNGGPEGNIWGIGPGSYSYYTGSAAGSYGTQIDGSATFDIADVPEPVTLSLFGAGLVCMGTFIRRRRTLAV